MKGNHDCAKYDISDYFNFDLGAEVSSSNAKEATADLFGFDDMEIVSDDDIFGLGE